MIERIAMITQRSVSDERSFCDQIAEELAVPTIVAESVVNVWRIGMTQGFGARDLTAIAQLYEHWAGVKIRATPGSTPTGDRDRPTKDIVIQHVTIERR